MSFDLLNLPRNVFNAICSHLDEKSLLRMREVSKTAKKIVDEFIVDQFYNGSTQMLAVEEFIVYEDEQKSHLTFVKCSSKRERFLWGICFRAAFSEFELSSKLHSKINYAVSIELVERFLDHLLPLFQRIAIKTLKLYTTNAECIRKCFDFVQSPISGISTFHSGEVELVEWLDFIRKTSPTWLRYQHLPLTKDSINILLDLADILDSIDIVVNRMTGVSTESITIPLVKTILSKKCRCFYFEDTEGMMEMAEAEELLQFFHHYQREFSFSALTTEVPQSIKVGEYEVDTTSWNEYGTYRCLIVNHWKYQNWYLRN